MVRTNYLTLSFKKLDEAERKKYFNNIKRVLLNFFKNHIGEENAVSRVQVFEEIFGDIEKIEIYKRLFLWGLLKGVLRELRKTGDCFVIIKKNKLFVLKTQLEANYYKRTLDREIYGLSLSKDKADEWVTNEKWRNLQ